MKRPEFSEDWRKIVKRAWSVRFIVLAGMLSAAEVALPLLAGFIPPIWFSILTFLAVSGAFVSRIVVQKDL